MTNRIETLGETRVMVCDEHGPTINGEGDAVSLIGQALGERASWVVVPATSLSIDFFRLATGLAGAIAQKFVNYRVGLAIVGNTDAFQEKSVPLRDFVRETNKGRQVWFVETFDQFSSKLEGRNVP